MSEEERPWIVEYDCATHTQTERYMNDEEFEGHKVRVAQAQEMAAVCPNIICDLTPDLGNSVRVLYGGSVNSKNAAKLLEQPDIDGALVGGASLNAQEFSNLIKLASSK